MWVVDVPQRAGKEPTGRTASPQTLTENYWRRSATETHKTHISRAINRAIGNYYEIHPQRGIQF